MVSDDDVTVWLDLPGDDPDDVAALHGASVVVHAQTNLVAVLGCEQFEKVPLVESFHSSCS